MKGKVGIYGRSMCIIKEEKRGDKGVVLFYSFVLLWG